MTRIILAWRLAVSAFAAAIFAVSVPAVAASSTDWAQFRFGLAKAGVNPHEKILSTKNVAKLAKIWSDKTRGDIYSSASVVGGTAFVGSYDDKVYAFDAATGASVWTAPTSGPIMSSPAVAKGFVYVGSLDDSVYAFDASTGSKVWSFRTGSLVRSSPAVQKGVV
ncbi:MAG: PQQ-binding-like beta-propeller repeat protein, partial [Rhizomicrobium sp.]